MSDYIQIGVTALRDPVTGDMLPAVPLYIRAGDADRAPAAPPGLLEDVAGTLADKMRQYIDGCKAEGVII